MDDAKSRLVYARDADEAVRSRQQLAREAVAGSMQRVARGVYLPGEAWAEVERRERYRLKVIAVASTRQGRAVLSFWSAAVLYGMPIVGDWPEKVHVSVGVARGGRSTGQLVRHVAPLPDDDVTEIDGLLVTTVARTVIDMASLPDTLTAVAIADHALHIDRFGARPPLLTEDELREQFDSSAPMRAHARVQWRVNFSTTEADSVLESVSRVNMHVVGAPPPVLQQRFDDYRGLIGWSEFSWPEHARVGESDGRAKYFDPRLRRGRTLEQVLYDEKIRADRLQAIGQSVTRWDWDTALHPERLRRHLAAAGLPVRPRR